MYSLRKCYTQPPGAHPEYAYKNKYVNFVSNKATAQIGASVRVLLFNAGPLARSQFASGRSCNRRTLSRFSVVFLSPRANAELVPNFHVALFAPHVALPLLDQISL
jgi:hypothetical protein